MRPAFHGKESPQEVKLSHDLRSKMLKTNKKFSDNGIISSKMEQISRMYKRPIVPYYEKGYCGYSNFYHGKERLVSVCWRQHDYFQKKCILKTLIEISNEKNSKCAISRLLSQNDENVLSIIAEYAVGEVRICKYRDCNQEIFISNGEYVGPNPGKFSKRNWPWIYTIDGQLFNMFERDAQTINAVCKQHVKLLVFCDLYDCDTVDFCENGKQRFTKCACGKGVICESHPECPNCKKRSCRSGSATIREGRICDFRICCDCEIRM